MKKYNLLFRNNENGQIYKSVNNNKVIYNYLDYPLGWVLETNPIVSPEFNKCELDFNVDWYNKTSFIKIDWIIREINEKVQN